MCGLYRNEASHHEISFFLLLSLSHGHTHKQTERSLHGALTERQTAYVYSYSRSDL